MALFDFNDTIAPEVNLWIQRIIIYATVFLSKNFNISNYGNSGFPVHVAKCSISKIN